MRDSHTEILRVRLREPGAIAAAAQRRRRRPVGDGNGRLMLIAADHPARGSLGVRQRPDAMANRRDMLDRLRVALTRPGVDGVLGTPDILEDLLLLGLLDDKVVIGSMNRGGLLGASFELDDRFTAYDATRIASMSFDGGKMLCRIDLRDAGTVRTLEACARAVTELAEHRLLAMVEPFLTYRDGAALRTDLSPEAVVRAVHIGQALGATSAYTWLKLPVVADMERVMEATTLPALLLGGDVTGAPEEAYTRWQRALKVPGVQGLVGGRALLYPPDDDVAAAVDVAAGLVGEAVP